MRESKIKRATRGDSVLKAVLMRFGSAESAKTTVLAEEAPLGADTIAVLEAPVAPGAGGAHAARTRPKDARMTPSLRTTMVQTSFRNNCMKLLTYDCSDCS